MKDAKGHGSNGRGGNKMPIPGHPYHMKSDAELRYIARDASEAAKAMQGHSPGSEGKYLDQVNDASTVLGFRARGGARVMPQPAAHQAGVEDATHEYNRDLSLRMRNGQVGSGMKFRG